MKKITIILIISTIILSGCSRKNKKIVFSNELDALFSENYKDLSDELKQEFDDYYKRDVVYVSLSFYDGKGYIKDTIMPYGIFDGYVVFESVNDLDSSLYEIIGDYDFYNPRLTSIFGYKDGKITRLSNLYNSQFIKDDNLSKIYKMHDLFEKEIYPEYFDYWKNS